MRIAPRVAEVQWRAARDAYLARIRPWAEARLRRAAQNAWHPVYDFLFEYYSFRPSHLLRWTPGFDVLLEGATHQDIIWSKFVATDTALILPASAFPRHRLSYLTWALKYLDEVHAREPSFACFGLHEWAMVYRESNVRHPDVPLRLSPVEIDTFVETQSLRCTHYDAWRFFSPAAAPRNRWALARADMTESDQPGCLHVNMDLYKFTYKIAPFCPSDVVADALELAAAARVIDMRASPYDLRAYGLAPLKIETRAGREEYIEHQRALFLRAQPLRERVRTVYARLLAACTPVRQYQNGSVPV